jgi:hypothetical protein
MPSVGSGTYSPGPNMGCSPEKKVGTGSIEAITCSVYIEPRIPATVSARGRIMASGFSWAPPWRASGPRWLRLRVDSLPMITLFPLQGDFCFTARHPFPYMRKKPMERASISTRSERFLVQYSSHRSPCCYKNDGMITHECRLSEVFFDLPCHTLRYRFGPGLRL